MYGGAICVWGWLKQLARAEERPLNKLIETIDSTKRGDHHKTHNLLWNFSDLVFVTTCFQIDIIYLCNMNYMLKGDLNPGFLQIMVMYVSLGPALMYMEIFLGQYVRHGCLYLKNISPLTCSAIGYGMILTMYVFSIACVSRLADCYMYLFRTLSSELPWMVCPKDSTPATCIDRALLVKCYLENRRDNCYPKLSPDLLSSRIYFKRTHSAFAKRIALLFIGWLTIYLSLKRSLSHTRTALKKLLPLMLLLFLGLIAPLLVHVSGGLSVAPFYTVKPEAFLSTATWMAAFRDFLRDHAVVRGGYQLIGCHIRPGPTAANLTIYSCVLTYLITVMSQIFSTGVLGVFTFYMKITHVETELYAPSYAKLFSFYPFALGMLEVRQLWSLVYFLLVALLTISYTMVNLAIMEDTMYDHYPILLRYKTYVKVILCVFGFFIDISTDVLADVDSYEDEILLQIGYRLTIIIVLILAISIGYIYGVERFSDDMNFLNGSQPTAYWKICWKILPFGVMVVLGGDIILIEFPRDNLPRMASNIIYVFLLCLAVLHLIHKIIMSIKARNVTGMLFQATPQWGPPLPEDRRMRNTYNPREETKYWRKENFCTHHCLLDKGFILSVIYREIDSRTSKAQHDTVFPEFAVTKQSKQNQVVIAIDKVSSTQLETFEEQVKEKVKYLEMIEEAKVNSKRNEDMVSKKHSSMTKSMEELDYRIEQIINQAEQTAQLEKDNNNATKVSRTSSKTKQRRQPTYVPKETPRPKRTKEATTTVDRADTKKEETAKFHTYAVQVPHFVLKPTVQILPQPGSAECAQERDKLQASQSSSSQREILQVKDGPSHAIISNKSKPGFPVILGSEHKPTKKLALRPRLRVMRKPRLPVWPLPLDTPRPTVCPLSRSSSSTSTSSREMHRQPSNYFLDVRLPPKANLLLPAFSVDIHSPPRSLGSSTASLELNELNDDPILREILNSVHPDLFPVEHRDVSRSFSRADTIHRDNLVPQNRPQPQPRTSIRNPLGSPRSPRPLPRTQMPSSTPIPATRPRPMVIQSESWKSATEEEAIKPSIDESIRDCSAKLDVSECDQKMARTEQEEVTVDIDQAIQIRIKNLLRGVRDPAGRATDQEPVPGRSSVKAKASDVSKAEDLSVGEIRDSLQTDKQGERASQESLNQSKTKKKRGGQSLTTNSVAARISAFGRKIAKRITQGSTSPKIQLTIETGDESNIPPEITDEEETPEDISLDRGSKSCEDPDKLE